MTTIVEAYVDAVLRRLIQASGYQASQFGRLLYAELEDRIFGTWPERHRWLRQGFSVNVLGTTATQDMLTLVDLRNALSHGAGRLTDRQSRDVKALVALEQRLCTVLDVRADSREVALGQRTAERAILVARAYILQFDDAVRSEHPATSI